jgi:hypothetical protein
MHLQHTKKKPAALPRVHQAQQIQQEKDKRLCRNMKAASESNTYAGGKAKLLISRGK